MSYDYQKQRAELFTDEGQRMLLRVRDNVRRLLGRAGAFQMEKAWDGVTGNSWTMLACVDRLVELGEIEELKRPCMGQHRTFIESRA